jgi:hypothetical protein
MNGDGGGGRGGDGGEPALQPHPQKHGGGGGGGDGGSGGEATCAQPQPQKHGGGGDASAQSPHRSSGCCAASCARKAGAGTVAAAAACCAGAAAGFWPMVVARRPRTTKATPTRLSATRGEFLAGTSMSVIRGLRDRQRSHWAQCAAGCCGCSASVALAGARTAGIERGWLFDVQTGSNLTQLNFIASTTSHE